MHEPIGARSIYSGDPPFGGMFDERGQPLGNQKAGRNITPLHVAEALILLRKSENI